jgi:hypothetical protein
MPSWRECQLISFLGAGFFSFDKMQLDLRVFS